MFRRFTRPSPSLVLSLLALFVAFGGTTYAATGGNFILGQPNSATSQTGLTSNNAGKALNVTQQSTGTGATALGLNVPAGKAPFTVNSSAKVANLNADKLDGLDGSALQKVVTGSCPGGSAIRAIASSGSVTCQNVSPTLLLQFTGLSPNETPSFTTTGGPLLIYFAGSGYHTAAQGAGFVQLVGRIDGAHAIFSEVYTNETASHKATIPVLRYVTGIPAGQHTFSMSVDQGTSDNLDDWEVTILELPH